MNGVTSSQSTSESVQHIVFIQATVYCVAVGTRLRIPGDPLYGEPFVCPGCGEHIPGRETR